MACDERTGTCDLCGKHDAPDADGDGGLDTMERYLPGSWSEPAGVEYVAVCGTCASAIEREDDDTERYAEAFDEMYGGGL